jgi:hypothetical protein
MNLKKKEKTDLIFNLLFFFWGGGKREILNKNKKSTFLHAILN